ncbi:conserved hypothetical protein [Talaromyces stipitatus ATCC 10500]|uniref:gamma-glutamylcyclotransferase n=1 Tax=Talaromyces stipitatus (strain ATCC 10500 / CBS 375.48 / QM 6759 / NRRL 1006) TaxID=441959 RepID=B8MB32_TALSN|nr:uncharacterized protein TSTA_124560 [Talaromyces stipitatus ATCC 10500]EED18733.1 conserved hypothetical protein [Talaromyces stipitatus ATCC 10500]
MTDWSTITMTPTPKYPRPPPTSPDRLQLGRDPTSIDADPNLYYSICSTRQTCFDRTITTDENPEKTVLYLAYGSNLSIEKFRGDRGIAPLSQVNVYVPELRLTFDLAGIPYLEPCFSGTQYRTVDNTHVIQERYKDIVDDDILEKKEIDLESGHYLIQNRGYNKDQWHKPLIGVVYEVTLSDYAHIIATEGGGNGYVDIVTPCFPFPSTTTGEYNPNDPTPDVPSGTAFMAHTLLSPPKSAYGPNSHLVRPVPSYAQPSARYLKLMTDGAAELDFPVTTFGQGVGQKLALYVLIPLMLVFIRLGELLADDDGITPSWLGRIFDIIRELTWRIYDVVLVKVLGDGERSIDDI